MKSDELLSQAPISDDERAQLNEFLKASVKPSEGSPLPPPNELPPDPEPTTGSLGLAQGGIDVVDEKAFYEELEAAQAELDLLKLAPQQRYLKILEREKISLEEARKIINTVVVDLGRHTERVQLTKQHSAVFQTRQQEDIERIHEVLEKELPHFEATVNTHISTHNLAASLVRYGKKEFPRETDDDFRAILTWIAKLPQPTYVLLNRKLIAFDRKVNVVFSEGYLENF